MSATLTIKMDNQLKQEARLLLDDIGMDFSTLITIFTKKFVREARVPFEITADPFYAEANQQRLRKSIAQLNSKRGVKHELVEDYE